MYSFGLHCLRLQKVGYCHNILPPSERTWRSPIHRVVELDFDSPLCPMRDRAHFGMIGSQPHDCALLRELLGQRHKLFRLRLQLQLRSAAAAALGRLLW
jgi:hypothetical protein